MATNFHKVTNNAETELLAAIDDNDLALSGASGDGTLFSTTLQYLTVGRTDTYTGEIIEVTSRTGDAFTLATRGAQGTTAASHEAGDRVECLITAGHITEIQDAINALENITGGTSPILDDVYLRFGTDSDIRMGYDEATDNRLEWTDGTNLLAYLTDLGTTGLFGVTGRLEAPQIGIAADIDLLTLTANLLTVAGDITASGDAAFNGGDLTSTASTFNMLVANVTTLNMLTSGNPTCTFGNGASSTLNLNFATIRHGGVGTVSLWNAINTTIAFAGAATSLTMGASNSGTCTIRNATFALTGTTAFTVAAPTTFSDNITIADAKNLVLNTTTGTKIGTATSQKLGFFNSTPIVQPSSTGELTGYSSAGLFAVLDGSTFTGNVGTKAYTIGDIVKHLKNLGLLAAS